MTKISDISLTQIIYLHYLYRKVSVVFSLGAFSLHWMLSHVTC